jgi:exodeoxyribonuclease VII small subunit
MAKERFEDALGKLEKIVSQLEQGDTSLEESLKLFEEGIRLSKICNQKLEEAEKRVEILLQDENGIVRPQPFAPATSSGQIASSSGQPPSASSGQAPSASSGQPPSASSGQASLMNLMGSLSEKEEE